MFNVVNADGQVPAKAVRPGMERYPWLFRNEGRKSISEIKAEQHAADVGRLLLEVFAEPNTTADHLTCILLGISDEEIMSGKAYGKLVQARLDGRYAAANGKVLSLFTDGFVKNIEEGHGWRHPLELTEKGMQRLMQF